jgi:hypothetical protein
LRHLEISRTFVTRSAASGSRGRRTTGVLAANGFMSSICFSKNMGQTTMAWRSGPV